MVMADEKTPGPDGTDATGLEAPIARGVELAKQLTNARSNQLDPAGFARIARSLAQELGMGVRVTEAAELAEQGFGGIVAIGSGSSRPPALVELWFGGDSTPEQPPHGAIALAGKGITFDSGGLSLKSPTAMYTMHTDCAGAAAVLGAMVALAQLGCETPVYAALPLAENIPGPDSVRPGDVVSMRGGVGLEIVDTDFEGRVVLADAVSLLQESQPRAIVSMATLTYQAMIALGPEIGALLGRDDELVRRMLSAAEQADEALWQLPWAERYADQIKSNAPGASYRNHPRADTGRAITAALMIGAFAEPGTPFAHVDFAGPAVELVDGGAEATGYGVAMLVELVRAWR